MSDQSRSGVEGTFELGGARFEVTVGVSEQPQLTTMWVRGLHWPGCCACEGAHAPISFGEGHVGGIFKVANADFWADTGVEVGLVECEVSGWLDTGDLPDWTVGSGPWPRWREG